MNKIKFTLHSGFRGERAGKDRKEERKNENTEAMKGRGHRVFRRINCNRR